MLNRLKSNISLTLVEVLVAMMILSTSAASVIGSFSYAFKFVQRAGNKLQAAYLGRQALERYRAIWIANMYDPRLDLQDNTDITSQIKSDYDGKIYLTITRWQPDPSTDLTKKIDITVDWVE
jgi:type II secretory pathway pseudopilin PulG